MLVKLPCRQNSVEYVRKLLAALFIEVFCKLYTDWRWFFYDSWNFYDLFCVILNSPVCLLFSLDLEHDSSLSLPSLSTIFFFPIISVFHK